MEGNLRLKIDWATLIVGCKFTIFALFYFVFEGNFPISSPQGAYIWRGDLTEGFLRYRFGGLIFGGTYTWRGLFSEFLRYSICSEKQLLPPQSRFRGFPFKSWFWNFQTVFESFPCALQRFQRTCAETLPTQANTNSSHLRQPLQLLLLRYFFKKELFLCLQTVDHKSNFFKRPFFDELPSSMHARIKNRLEIYFYKIGF